MISRLSDTAFRQFHTLSKRSGTASVILPLVSLFQSNHHTQKCACSLPFVCRLEDATTRKPKQSLAQFGNVAKPINANGRMKQQQSATPGNNMEALCYAFNVPIRPTCVRNLDVTWRGHGYCSCQDARAGARQTQSR